MPERVNDAFTVSRERTRISRILCTGEGFTLAFIFVFRCCNYPHAQVLPFTIRDQIPPFSVPLKPKDGEMLLDLQTCVTEVYNTNRYAMRIDYSKPPLPPFGSVDTDWAGELLP